jgi:ankyrin repeat protein
MKYLVQFIFGFLLVLNAVRCQNRKYAPGFDFDLFNGSSNYALAKAVEADDTTGIVYQLVNHKASVDAREPKFGHTTLLLAVANDKERSVYKLLELGADPNAKSLSNSSPFLTACKFGFNSKNPTDLLKALIRYGADVNGKQVDTTNDQFGKRSNFSATPLQLVCIYGTLPMVKILVENGAKLDTYGENSHAIVSTAVLRGQLDIIRYLLIDQQAPIPDYVLIRQAGTAHEKKMTITDVLNEADYKDDFSRRQQREEILRYLKSKGRV